MNTTPPPLIRPSKPKKTFFHHAATYCLLAPLVGVWVTTLANAASAGGSAPTTRLEEVMWASLSALFPLSGVVAGIISLFGIRRNGRAGILWKAVTGISIVVLLALALVPSVLAARERARQRFEQQSPQAGGAQKQFEQKERLFKMNPPGGWHWDERPGNVRVSDPKTGNAISIQFAPAANYSSAEIKELLRKGNEKMVERFVKPSGGVVIKEEERELAGTYARQLTFLQSHNGETGTVTYISLFAKGHAFTVTFGGPDENQVAEIRRSVETLRFE